MGEKKSAAELSCLPVKICELFEFSIFVHSVKNLCEHVSSLFESGKKIINLSSHYKVFICRRWKALTMKIQKNFHYKN